MQSFKSTIQYNSIWIFDNTALIYWCQLIICSFKCSLVSKPSHQKLSQGGKSDNIQLKAIFSNNKESCHRYMFSHSTNNHFITCIIWDQWEPEENEPLNPRPLPLPPRPGEKTENQCLLAKRQSLVIFSKTYHVRIHHHQYWGSLLECLKTRSSFPIVHHLNIELANHSNCLTPTVKGHDNQFHILNTDRKASKRRVKSLDHAQHYTYHYLSYGW